MRIRLTKIFSFEMAHALPGYDGACRHIHGHSFKLEVCVIGEALQAPGHPKNGMVMDFKSLKDLVKQAFIDRYDHALLLPENTAPEALAMLETTYGNLITWPVQPTCENMIAACVAALQSIMPDGVQLWSIRLAETAASYAEWYATDQD